MDGFRVKFSLRTKLFITMSVVLGVLGVLISIFLMVDVGNILKKTEEDKLGSLLKEQTHEVNLLFGSSNNLAQKVANLPEIADYLNNPKRLVQDNKILIELKQLSISEKILNLYLLDASGSAIVSLDPALLNMDYSFREYFTEAMASRSASTWVVGMTSQVPDYYFSSPVVNNLGKIVGVVVVKTDAQIVGDSLKQSNLSKIGYLIMTDINGVVIHSNKPDSLFKSVGSLDSNIKIDYQRFQTYAGREILSLQYDEIQKLITAKTDLKIVTSYDKVDNLNELMGVAKVDDQPYFLVAEENLNVITANINSLILKIILILGGVVGVAVLIEMLIAGRMMEPLNRLSFFSKAITEGKMDTELKVEKTGDEVELLANSMVKMVTTLKEFNQGLEQKIEEKTVALENSLEVSTEQNHEMAEARIAMLNVLEDLDSEKNNISNEKKRIETVLASIGDGVLVTDIEGRITMMNKVAEKLSGYQMVDALGKPFKDIFKFSLEEDTETKMPDLLDEAKKVGGVSYTLPKTVLLTKGGNSVSVLASASLLKDSNGSMFGCVIVIHDITKERNLDKSKDEFLSVASHQLRTPLGGIRWNLEMLQDGGFGPVSPEVKEVLDTIYKGSIKMIDLVNDLLNVSRIDQGRVMDDPTEIDFAKVVTEAVNGLKPLAEKAGVVVKVNIENEMPKILIDAKRLSALVSNLVSNSIKYHGENGKVDVNLSYADEVLKMIVADNGIGIPSNDMDKVFGKFFRANNAVKSETEGSGLGLYICKKFVDGWGGKIGVESTEGKGTTITVYLPKNIRQTKGV